MGLEMYQLSNKVIINRYIFTEALCRFSHTHLLNNLSNNTEKTVVNLSNTQSKTLTDRIITPLNCFQVQQPKLIMLLRTYHEN